MSFILEHVINKAFSIVSLTLAAAYGFLIKKIKKNITQQHIIRACLLTLLQERITESYHDYLEKGVYPVHAQQNIDNLLAMYVSLGGNSTIPGLVEKLKMLPTELQKSERRHKNDG